MANRRLIPNELEADLVRRIFNRFIRLRSTTLLCKELNEQGFRTKRRRGRDGRMNDGYPFNKTTLYKILNNRIYLGEIRRTNGTQANTRPSSTRTYGTRPMPSWHKTIGNVQVMSVAKRRHHSRGCFTARMARR